MDEQTNVTCAACGAQVQSATMPCSRCGAPASSGPDPGTPVTEDVAMTRARPRTPPASSPAPGRMNTLAIVALVLALFSTIPGIICGHIALYQIRRSGDRGRGLAIAALVLGYGLLLIFVIIAASV